MPIVESAPSTDILATSVEIGAAACVVTSNAFAALVIVEGASAIADIVDDFALSLKFMFSILQSTAFLFKMLLF